MGDVVCTLFEGDYHYGVAALINSLYQNGYRGIIWAGYKGQLPPWIGDTVTAEEAFHEWKLAEDCAVRFVPLTTDKHLTWFKPDFMLDLFDRLSPEAESIFYFDPDIVIDAPWSLYQDWVRYGVALCACPREEMPATHPVRLGWKKYYESLGFQQRNQQDLYINGGCVGVTPQTKEFLKDWKSLQDPVALSGDGHPYYLTRADATKSKIDLFPTDQDSLNATMEVTSSPLTIMGPDAMAFQPGYPIMYHAVGGWKPWRPLIALKGFRKIRATRKFLSYSNFPIKLYSPLAQLLKKVDCALGMATGHVYRYYRRVMWGENPL